MWWAIVSPSQLFVGGLLLALGLFVLFWHQLFQPIARGEVASVTTIYTLPPGVDKITIEVLGAGGSGNDGAGGPGVPRQIIDEFYPPPSAEPK